MRPTAKFSIVAANLLVLAGCASTPTIDKDATVGTKAVGPGGCFIQDVIPLRNPDGTFVIIGNKIKTESKLRFNEKCPQILNQRHSNTKDIMKHRAQLVTAANIVATDKIFGTISEETHKILDAYKNGSEQDKAFIAETLSKFDLTIEQLYEKAYAEPANENSVIVRQNPNEPGVYHITLPKKREEDAISTPESALPETKQAPQPQ